MSHYNIDISNPDKIIFPKEKVNKKELVEYYDKISKYMLKHVKNRPITMERYPDGIDKKGFYMKDIPDYFPDWIERVTADKKEDGTYTLVLCQNKDTLKYLANQACITPHIWLCEKDQIKKPDKMVFDLDPSSDDLELVKEAALALKEVIEESNLSAFVMTTGSRGLHVIVPIKAEYSFDEVRNIAVEMAQKVVDDQPNKFTLEQRKNKRGDKVFLDTLRNAYGQTSVPPYGLRPVKDASIATPLTWDELRDNPLEPRKYTIHNIFKRLAQIEDPWLNIHRYKSSLSHLVSE
ncbi:MAG: non-homologous end-joining DNA ligase [Candidatus Izemoplasmatales bacterium]